MIPAGTDLKYRVKALIPGFSLARDNFFVIVKNRWEQVKYIIEKSEMMTDDDGNFYLMLTNVQKGLYKAYLHAEKEDTDFDTGIQNLIDAQVIAKVGECDCYDVEHDCPTDGVSVSYERVWTVNVGGYVYLAEEDGTPILDADGNKIFLKKTPDESPSLTLHMTGEQLSELLEQRNNNGKIDTIPEMIDAAKGLEEDTEYSEATVSDIDNMMNNIFNENKR